MKANLTANITARIESTSESTATVSLEVFGIPFFVGEVDHDGGRTWGQWATAAALAKAIGAPPPEPVDPSERRSAGQRTPPKAALEAGRQSRIDFSSTSEAALRFYIQANDGGAARLAELEAQGDEVSREVLEVLARGDIPTAEQMRGGAVEPAEAETADEPEAATENQAETVPESETEQAAPPFGGRTPSKNSMERRPHAELKAWVAFRGWEPPTEVDNKRKLIEWVTARLTETTP